MITAPTPCFFTLRSVGETAKQMVAEFAGGCASDIETLVFVSATFECDISAINSMDKALSHAKTISHIPTNTQTERERYNPLYVPGHMSLIDETLNLDPRHDGVRFVGMDGNPFTLKMTEVCDNGIEAITAKVEYTQFEIPAYSDIALANKELMLN